jgi:hypothetical protein
MDDKVCTKRRQILARGIGLAGASALGMTSVARDAAAAKTSKAALLYQDHPQNGKRCGDCKFFSPDSGSSTAGTCEIVEGTVDRNGWCMSFSPRT